MLVGLENEIFTEDRLSKRLSKFDVFPGKVFLPVQFPYIFPTVFTLKIFLERPKEQLRLQLFQLAYYLFAKSRCYLTKRT